MTALDRLHQAEAAAREAVDAPYSGAIYRAALRDLLAALDAARGEAVVRGRIDEFGELVPATVYFPTPQAPPAAAVCAPDSSMAPDSGHTCASLEQAPPAAAVPAGFADWLAREMPAGTVIGDPHWWAKLIARRFAQFAAKENTNG